MTGDKRCLDCIRPICQRKLTLNGCKQKNDEEIPLQSFESHFILANVNPIQNHFVLG